MRELLKSLKRLIEKIVRSTARRISEPFNLGGFRKPARYDIDDKLAEYLSPEGVFIEVGATDGYTESNTYNLEKYNGWRGVLIEPIPDLYRKCVRERPRSQVYNCALVSDDYHGDTVVMKQGYLMSTVKDALGEEEKEHLEKARHFHGARAEEITVPARTLTSILDEAGVTHIDFFSLDVEGYEHNVLRGLDFDRYRPTYMLIELLDDEKRQEVEKVIASWYEPVAQLSKRDYLYRAK